MKMRSTCARKSVRRIRRRMGGRPGRPPRSISAMSSVEPVWKGRPPRPSSPWQRRRELARSLLLGGFLPSSTSSRTPRAKIWRLSCHPPLKEGTMWSVKFARN